MYAVCEVLRQILNIPVKTRKRRVGAGVGSSGDRSGKTLPQECQHISDIYSWEAGRQDDDISKRVVVIPKSPADRALGQENVQRQEPATPRSKAGEPLHTRVLHRPRRTSGGPGRPGQVPGAALDPGRGVPGDFGRGHLLEEESLPSRSREGRRGALLTHLVKGRRERGSQPGGVLEREAAVVVFWMEAGAACFRVGGNDPGGESRLQNVRGALPSDALE